MANHQGADGEPWIEKRKRQQRMRKYSKDHEGHEHGRNECSRSSTEAGPNCGALVMQGVPAFDGHPEVLECHSRSGSRLGAGQLLGRRRH
jgi:hypothetical protein